MSTQDLSGPISSLSLLLVQTQAARWKAAAPEQLTGAYLYLYIAKSGYLFHGFSSGMDARLEWYIHPRITQIDSHINVTKVSKWIRIDKYNLIRIEKIIIMRKVLELENIKYIMVLHNCVNYTHVYRVTNAFEVYTWIIYQ